MNSIALKVRPKAPGIFRVYHMSYQQSILTGILVGLVIGIILPCTDGFGQPMIRKKADKFFSRSDYHKAIPYYITDIARHQHPNSVKNLAACYWHTRDYDLAVHWYSNAVATENCEPIHYLHYAQALMSAGNYSLAEEWLKKYSGSAPDDRRAKHLLRASRMADQLKQDSSNYQVSRMEFPGFPSVLCPLPYREGLIFVSNRYNFMINRRFNYTGYSSLDLYHARLEDGNISGKPRLLQGQINSRFHDGPATIGGEMIYFTRSNQAPDQSGMKQLSIWSARLSGGSWIQTERLPFVKDAHSYAHPTISADGNWMIFAADLPGGYGQMDLYVVHRKGEQWSNPVNLGPAINTEGNEVFPVFNGNQRLYFSSDGHIGLGGLDIYEASYYRDKWDHVINPGYPLNSNKDDFSLSWDSTNTLGYFSSNRSGIPGMDEIYRIKRMAPAEVPCEPFREQDLCFTISEESSQDLDTTILQYEFDLGDGTKVRGKRAYHCYQQTGVYTLKLNVIDVLTNDLYFNEATYELVIPEPSAAYIHSPDTAITGEPLVLDASMSALPGCQITAYHWDLGDGYRLTGEKVMHTYRDTGLVSVRLTVSGDSAHFPCQTCSYKPVRVIASEAAEALGFTPQKPGERLRKLQSLETISRMQDIHYTIELASVDTPIPLKEFESLGEPVTVRQVSQQYHYTVGDYEELLAAHPMFVKAKQRGFRQAMVKALKNNQLITEEDTTLFLKPTEDASLYRVTLVKGTLTDEDMNPLEVEIAWEDLIKQQIIGRTTSNAEDGSFTIELENGRIYGYYIEMDDYLPYSNHLDLRWETKHIVLRDSIRLLRFKDLGKDPQILNNLFFGFDQYTLEPASYSELARVAALLKRNLGSKIEIAGHTDNLGTSAYNLVLSKKRANAVKHYLIDQGCNESNIIAVGYGSSQPMNANLTDDDRRQNRRVSIKWLPVK